MKAPLHKANGGPATALERRRLSLHTEGRRRGAKARRGSYFRPWRHADLQADLERVGTVESEAADGKTVAASFVQLSTELAAQRKAEPAKQALGLTRKQIDGLSKALYLYSLWADRRGSHYLYMWSHLLHLRSAAAIWKERASGGHNLLKLWRGGLGVFAAYQLKAYFYLQSCGDWYGAIEALHGKGGAPTFIGGKTPSKWQESLQQIYGKEAVDNGLGPLFHWGAMFQGERAFSTLFTLSWMDIFAQRQRPADAMGYLALENSMDEIKWVGLTKRLLNLKFVKLYPGMMPGAASASILAWHPVIGMELAYTLLRLGARKQVLATYEEQAALLLDTSTKSTNLAAYHEEVDAKALEFQEHVRTHQEQLAQHRAKVTNNMHQVWQQAQDYRKQQPVSSIAALQLAPTQIAPPAASVAVAEGKSPAELAQAAAALLRSAQSMADPSLTLPNMPSNAVLEAAAAMLEGRGAGA